MKVIKHGNPSLYYNRDKSKRNSLVCQFEESEFICYWCGCEFTCDESETINLRSADEVRFYRTADERDFNGIAYVRCPHCNTKLKKLLK